MRRTEGSRRILQAVLGIPLPPLADSYRQIVLIAPMFRQGQEARNYKTLAIRISSFPYRWLKGQGPLHIHKGNPKETIHG